MIDLRAGIGWQTTLADLSLILFMVATATLSQQDPAATRPKPAAAASPQSEALARWQAGAGAPPLADWLALQAPDGRQQLTVVVPYRAGGVEAALNTASELARQAGPLGARVRIVVEPGAEEPIARLAHDRPSLARPLQQDQGLSVTRE